MMAAAVESNMLVCFWKGFHGMVFMSPHVPNIPGHE